MISWQQWRLPVKRLVILEACLIGVVSGLSAVILKQGIGWLGAWRVQSTEFFPPLMVLPAIGLSFGYLSGLLIEQFAPEATGSGIPQVKAVLAKFPIALNLRVAVAKLLSTTLSLAAGLTMGRQGPTVLIGAAVAAQLSRWLPNTPEQRRQLIAAGAGAGLAAGFNTPLAGTMFVVEELLQDVSNTILGVAILACFLGAVISRLLGGGSLILNLPLVQQSASLSVPEIPFYLLLGVLAGIFSGLFNRGIFASLNFYQRLRLGLPTQIGLTGMGCGAIVALLPEWFHNNAYLREVITTGAVSWEFAALAFFAYFFLTIFSYGSGAPGGLFQPSLVLGSALGYIVGTFEVEIMHLGLPVSYALAGMGAFFSGVSKAPMTAIIMVFELTTDFNLVLPLMISCASSYLVSDFFVKGSLYQKLLEWYGYKLPQKDILTNALINLTVADVMQSEVETLSSHLSLEETLLAFTRSLHRGFPVIEEGKLVGIITQSDLDLEDFLQRPRLLREIMTPNPLTVAPRHRLPEVLHLLDRYKLSHLPVMENQKLVGIITRGDIIRTEARKLQGEVRFPGDSNSYLVYQTQAPAVGKGRILLPLTLPLSSPQHLSALLRLAADFARNFDYEIECLYLLTVASGVSPSQDPTRTMEARRLLQQAERLGRELRVSVHTQIRLTHSLPQTILDTLESRPVDMLIMDWQLWSSAISAMINQAKCDVLLVKLGNLTRETRSINKNWLVPVAGGPNSQRALTLLPALLHSRDKVRLCQVFPPKNLFPNKITTLKAGQEILTKTVLPKLKFPRHIKVLPLMVCAASVSEAVIDIAEKGLCDGIILGASRESFLSQVVGENIPAAIISGCDCLVIIVRGRL